MRLTAKGIPHRVWRKPRSGRPYLVRTKASRGLFKIMSQAIKTGHTIECSVRYYRGPFDRDLKNPYEVIDLTITE